MQCVLSGKSAVLRTLGRRVCFDLVATAGKTLLFHRSYSFSNRCLAAETSTRAVDMEVRFLPIGFLVSWSLGCNELPDAKRLVVSL